MEFSIIILLLALVFGAVPPTESCNLEETACEVLEMSAEAMLDIQSVNIESLAGDIELTFEGETNGVSIVGSGPIIVVPEREFPVETQMTFSLMSDLDESIEFQVTIDDDTLYLRDSDSGDIESTPLGDTSLPVLRFPEEAYVWDTEGDTYTLNIRLGEFLNAETSVDLLVGLFGDESIRPELEEILANSYEALNESAYTIVYDIDESTGLINGYTVSGSLTLIGPTPEDQLGMTVDLGVVLSGYDEPYTIEAVVQAVGDDVEIESIAMDTDPRFAPFQGIPNDTEGVRAVEPAEDLAEGVVQGITDEGIAYIGSPDAPVVLAEFGDFSCPHCGEFMPTMESLVANYVRSGVLRVEFRPLTFVGRDLSVVATRGALCAAEQGAFWEYHHMLFDIQHAETAAAFTSARTISLAEQLGLDTDSFQVCLDTDRPDLGLAMTEELRAALDVNATPTLAYRTLSDTEWQRFTDDAGNPITRPDDQALIDFIEAYAE